MTFAEYLEAQGLSARSVKLYSAVGRKAEGYPSPEDLLRDESLAPTTRKMYGKAMLHYAAWRGDDELLARIKAARPRGVPRRTRAVSALNWKREWLPLIRELNALRDEEPADWAALLILAHSGMRLSDVLELTVDDLRRALKYGSIAIIQKKTQRERAFMVTEPIHDAVSFLAMEDSPRVTPTITVEQILQTKRCPSRKGIEDRLRRTLAQAGVRAEIDKKVTPYVCRRTMADAIRRATGDMKLVQEFLGHDNPKTTAMWYQDHLHLDELEEAAGKVFGSRG